MLLDQIRAAKYRQAIEEVIQPGDVVADLGAGTGILSMMASRAGASKVYAMEIDPRLCRDGAALTVANGFSPSQIEWVQGDLREASLPEYADVLVSELIGASGIDEEIVRLISRASIEFLKPGGIVIPADLSTFLQPVSCQSYWESLHDFDGLSDVEGFDFSATTPAITCLVPSLTITRDSSVYTPLATAQIGLVIPDFTLMVGDLNLVTTSHQVTTDGILHGFVSWFTSQLSPSVSLTTDPTQPGTVWGWPLYPTSQEVPVLVGDTIDLSLNLVFPHPAASGQLEWSITVTSNSVVTHSETLNNIPYEEV
jgi:protein arginine N-methyltransferase 1